jgi:transposase
VCILHQDGEILRHRNLKTRPEAFRKAIAPYREDLVVAVEWILTWSWLADLWARDHLPCVLRPALSMTASHGDKAKHDTLAAHNIAVLLRGGMLPKASVSPAEMRATRDLLRRRLQLTRTRAALLAHVQPTNSPYNLPAIGQQLADKANRDGVAARVRDLAVQKSVAGDLALIDYEEQRLREVELTIVQTATQHHAQPLYRLPSSPGISTMLSVVLRYAIHDLTRCPRVQACVSYCRLVTCATASAGTRDGTSGAKSGKAYLTWAFSDAAVLFLRHNPAAQPYLVRWESKHGKGKALTIVAQQLARAVSDRLTRETTFKMQQFLNGSGSGAVEPTASLDAHGLSLAIGCSDALSASGNAWAHIGALAPIPRPLIGHPLRLLRCSERRSRYRCAAPPPHLERTGQRAALNRHVA